MSRTEFALGIGETLREIRLALRLSLTDVARALAVAEGTVSRWETGDRRAGGFELMQLRRYFDDRARAKGMSDQRIVQAINKLGGGEL
jgi:predicted transcriptional regulator